MTAFYKKFDIWAQSNRGELANWIPQFLSTLGPVGENQPFQTSEDLNKKSAEMVRKRKSVVSKPNLKIS